MLCLWLRLLSPSPSPSPSPEHSLSARGMFHGSTPLLLILYHFLLFVVLIPLVFLFRFVLYFVCSSVVATLLLSVPLLSSSILQPIQLAFSVSSTHLSSTTTSTATVLYGREATATAATVYYCVVHCSGSGKHVPLVCILAGGGANSSLASSLVASCLFVVVICVSHSVPLASFFPLCCHFLCFWFVCRCECVCICLSSVRH